MSDAQDTYIQMWAACLHVLKRPFLPTRVRFMRGWEEGVSWLMCVVLGPEHDGSPQVVALLVYGDGRVAGPEAVAEDRQADLIAQFD